MTSFRTKYSLEFKHEVVRNYLAALVADPLTSKAEFLSSSYPSLPKSTIYKWTTQFGDEIAKELNMSVNETDNKFGSEAEELSSERKFSIVQDVASLDEESFGRYCREKGLYASDVKRWIETCKQANTPPVKIKVMSDTEKELQRKLKEALAEASKLKDANKDLKTDLNKANKALSVYAAKIIAMENFDQLFNNKKED